MHGCHKLVKKKKNIYIYIYRICKAQHLPEYQITMMYTVNMSQFCQLYFNKAEIFKKCLSKYYKYFTAKCYKELKLTRNWSQITTHTQGRILYST